MLTDIHRLSGFASLTLFLLILCGCESSPPRDFLFDIEQRMNRPKSKQQEQLDQLLLQAADGMLLLPALKRELEGRRLLGVSRTYLKRVSYLSYAYQLTGYPRYAYKVEELLLEASAFSDWNPSHFLDVAEMTLALAVGLDWCRPALSSATIKQVEDAIVDKGLKTSQESNNHWLEAKHNWNQVCNAGLAVGAMAVYDRVPDLAQSIIARSKQSIKLPEEEYNPHGAYPEGSGYWNYGTSFHVVFLDAYSYFFPEEVLEVSDAFLNSSQYMLHVMGPTGSFNYADNSGRSGLMMPMFWMAQQLGDPRVLYHQLREVELLLDGTKSLQAEGTNLRLFPFLLLYLSEDLFKERLDMSSQSLSWSGGGPNPVSFHRSGWGLDATYVGLKGGSPGVNHGHMDVGSFVLDAAGKRWVIDLGAHNYHKLESQGVDLWNRQQNSQRWEILRYNNFSHSTLVVDNELQPVDQKVELLEVGSSDSSQYTTLDLSPMYPTLEGVMRTVTLEKGTLVTISDEVKNDGKSSLVRWAFPTRATIGIRGATATLTMDDQQITVEILSPETDWKTYSAQPMNLFEDANPGVTMLGFETEVAPDALEELLVEFRIGEQEAM